MRRLHLQTLFVVAVVLLAIGLPSEGRIIYVDDDGNTDFDTIQAAIDDANDADVILVAPGTYTGDGNRDIDFLGKAITLKSENGPETCIIDAGGRPYVNDPDDAGGRQYVDDPDADLEPHRGFHFHSCEDANSVVQGLTITGGYITYHQLGGGILCDNRSPHIANCIVTGNYARFGAGIAAINSAVRVVDCVISHNVAIGAYGGTVEASKSYFGESPCETIVAGDINGDCRVDFTDLAILTRHWLAHLPPQVPIDEDEEEDEGPRRPR